MRRFTAIVAFIAAAIPASAAAQSHSAASAVLLQMLAQQEASDPFLQQVNAELDRRDGQPQADAAASTSTNTRGTLYYLQALSGLAFVIALILALGYLARRAAGKTPLLAGAELGRILGRLYLNRNATLFFVETGGKVLLIGVTGQSVTTLGQFDADAFNPEAPAQESSDFNPESFLAQLTASSQSMRTDAPPRDDDDMHSLRRDIQRLQDYLREESRETSD